MIDNLIINMEHFILDQEEQEIVKGITFRCNEEYIKIIKEIEGKNTDKNDLLNFMIDEVMNLDEEEFISYVKGDSRKIKEDRILVDKTIVCVSTIENDKKDIEMVYKNIAFKISEEKIRYIEEICNKYKITKRELLESMVLIFDLFNLVYELNYGELDNMRRLKIKISIDTGNKMEKSFKFNSYNLCKNIKKIYEDIKKRFECQKTVESIEGL